MSKSLFLVALLPDRETQTLVRQIQQALADDFGVVAALRSPPHITLIPPFAATDRDIEILKDKLWKLFREQQPVSYSINGFGHFDDHVIYVQPIQNEQVSEIQQRIAQLFRTDLHWLKTKLDGPFHPHITLAYRDMKPELFPSIWATVAQQEFVSNEMVQSVFVLRHDGQRWRVFTEIPFSGQNA